MADVSQSRYSIVERLTSQKLQIMDEKQRIEGDIEAKKIQILQYAQDIEQARKDSAEELKSSIKSYEFNIKKIRKEIASSEVGKASKAKLCDEKIKQIDNALEAIQEISRNSVEEAKQ